MSILVTGGGGSLAGAFDRIGSIDGFGSIVCVDRSELDITSEESIRMALDRYTPRVVINTAAYNAVDKAEEEPERAERINGIAPGVLARLCAARSIAMIHYTTDYVFDGMTKEGYEEQDEPHPINVYGRSKREGEIAVKATAQAFPQWKYYIIRTSRLFGVRGQSPDAKSSFPDLIIERIKRGELIRAINEEVSSPTFVDDLASATIAMIKGDVASGVYHRTNDGACTWYEFAVEVVHWMHAHGRGSVSVEAVAASMFPRKAQRQQYSVLRSTKLPALRSWKEALGEYIS